MEQENRDKADLYDETSREEALDNGEMDSAEEGFLKGYEDDADSTDVDEDDDEAIKG